MNLFDAIACPGFVFVHLIPQKWIAFEKHERDMGSMMVNWTMYFQVNLNVHYACIQKACIRPIAPKALTPTSKSSIPLAKRGTSDTSAHPKYEPILTKRFALSHKAQSLWGTPSSLPTPWCMLTLWWVSLDTFKGGDLYWVVCKFPYLDTDRTIPRESNPSAKLTLPCEGNHSMRNGIRTSESTWYMCQKDHIHKLCCLNEGHAFSSKRCM